MALGPKFGHLVAVLLCGSAVTALGEGQAEKEGLEMVKQVPGPGEWKCWGKVCLEGAYTRWSHEARGPRWEVGPPQVPPWPRPFQVAMELRVFDVLEVGGWVGGPDGEPGGQPDEHRQPGPGGEALLEGGQGQVQGPQGLLLSTGQVGASTVLVW